MVEENWGEGERGRESYIKQLFYRQCINYMYIAVQIRLNMASE